MVATKANVAIVGETKVYRLFSAIEKSKILVLFSKILSRKCKTTIIIIIVTKMGLYVSASQMATHRTSILCRGGAAAGDHGSKKAE